MAPFVIRTSKTHLRTIKQDTLGWISITSGSTAFLVVGFERLGKGMVQDEPYIWFVDSGERKNGKV